MSAIARRPRRLRLPVTVALSVLSALVLFTGAGLASPSETFAYTKNTWKETLCDGVALRKKPSVNAKRFIALKDDRAVRVVGSPVRGGSWKATCGGTSVSGRNWYRISRIGDRSVKSLYGVDYVYAATGLFRGIWVHREVDCTARLRTKPTTSSKTKVILREGVRISAKAIVDGTRWRVDCDGRVRRSDGWYRITAVNGKSVKSLYGVRYLYSAFGLFSELSTTSSVPKPAPTPTPTPTPAPSPTPAPTHLEGIDVSHWQGSIDWAKVKADGKRFAYIKASEDTYFVDNKYEVNRSRAKANGIVVGAYHFARPDGSENDAVEEADHFVDTARPVAGELLPVLDLEQTGGLGPKKLQAWALAFLNRVHERTGVKGAIYVSPSFWRNEVGDSTILADNGYKVLWVAHWTSASSPSMPAENWGGSSWTFWQYSSSGKVSGIDGRVDLNRYNGTKLGKVRIP